MRRARLAAAVATALALGALTLLWHGTRSVDPREHAEYDATLRELRRLDRALNQDVLRIRLQLLDSYDPLVDSYRRLDELWPELDRLPAYLDAAAAAQLGDQVRKYEAALRDKRARVEAFKSRNAVLENSLRYLPVVGERLAERADAAAPGSPFGVRLRRAFRHTLAYSVTTDGAQAIALGADLDALLAERAAFPPELRGAELDAFLKHARTVLSAEPEVDGMVREIIEAPVAASEEAVARAYAAGRERAEGRAGIYRGAMYGLCVLLFGLVLSAVARTRLAAAQLAEANLTLEGKVRARTSELDARHRDMRLVLDNVEQGLLTLDPNGHVVGEQSAAVAAWLPAAGKGAALWDALSPHDARAAAWLKLGWESIAEGVLPLEVVLEQLPGRVAAGARHLTFAYRPIFEGERLDRMLVMLSDVTRQVEHERAEAERRELTSTFERIMRDRQGFLEFFAESGAIVARLRQPPGVRDAADAARDVHTLKGNTAFFGIASVSSACHEVEAALVDGELEAVGGEQLGRIATSWTAFAERVRPVLGLDDDRIEMTRADYEGLCRLLTAGGDQQTLWRALDRLKHEPAERRLGRVAEQARSLANRMGKGAIAIAVDAGPLRFDARRWAPFWASFVHLVRNALDHGIEPPHERAAAGKPARGELTLRAFERDGFQVVEIGDDGRGVDWSSVAAKARARGLPHQTEADLLRALFQGGLSTRDRLTEYSGRGVGLSAAYRACLDLGGEVRVRSRPGAGTSLQFWVPERAPNAPPASRAPAASARDAAQVA